ncbi:MAG TPA: S8 family peptidase [Acidimicrobiia bacterium]|nr:S8 family peptidase [Acidimicrobiia bacterium]
MHARGIRAALLALLLGVGGVAAAGCVPPPPPVNTLCSASAAPAAGAQVALVAQGGAQPTVVKFQAHDPAQVWMKVAQLNQTGHVLAVGPDQLVHADVVNPPGNNPAFTQGLQTDFQPAEVDFPSAWNAVPSLVGTGVRVAVVDTGVQADHPDLAGNVTVGNDFVFGNAASSFARVDGNGHGTHVAGTIAAVDNTIGVIGGAPRATIVPVRVLDCGGAGSTSSVAAGILWASDPAGGAAKVISMSLGGPGPDPVLQIAIQVAINRGAVVVSAAGNCGDNFCLDGLPNTAEYPGAYAGADFPTFHGHGVIAVGALDATNPGSIFRAGFSNSNDYVTIAAPGVNIYSTVPYSGRPHSSPSGYGPLSGTSMATPHVSAVAALIFQRCPNDTPTQVENEIVSGAQALAPPPPGTTGFVSPAVGMLRADAAVSGVCP